MRILPICFFFVCSTQFVHAQFKVRFILKEQTAIRHDSIYITGTFSNWDSAANKNYLMQPYGTNEKSIVLNLKDGIRYKFTRGNWFTVEKQYLGNEVLDRAITINKDTILIDSVSCWRDETITDKKYALSHETSDTNRASITAAIAYNYAFFPEWYNTDSALYYAQKALQLQEKIMSSGEYKLWLGAGQTTRLIQVRAIIATLLHSLGNYTKSLEIRLENLKLSENERDKFIKVDALRDVISDYTSMKQYQEVLSYAKAMDDLVKTLPQDHEWFKSQQWNAKNLVANAFYNLHQLDSALYYAQQMTAVDVSTNYANGAGYLAPGDLLLGDIYSANGSTDLAFSYYRKVMPNAEKVSGGSLIALAYEGMAKLFQKQNQYDSALVYATQAFRYFQVSKKDIQAWGENSDSYIADISPLIANLYNATNQPDSAYKYLHLSVAIKDSLYNIDKIRQFQTLTFNEVTRRQQLEQQAKDAQVQYENKIKMYSLIAGMLVILVVAFILYRNNKQKQKANILLQSQKQEIETTLGELKTTQKQLIQSEKMASLGELTAGIAHEIQNPLNFVNNFSEVSNELLDEMVTEFLNGNANVGLEIREELSQNLEKINHHGKRADAIVKGMLQHSRTSSGQKEATDINALCDEYLRLAYHGLRAKDKEFNATMKTDFDETIGNIKIIPQDIGRVLLNLYSNAFYAVYEKKKQQAENYEPTVLIKTKKLDGKIEISVKDNGGGIPEKIKEKIFQPFFTTKPTGQGTGLGLSLSYDIIKAHGGEIKVETKDGEGSEFVIQLTLK